MTSVKEIKSVRNACALVAAVAEYQMIDVSDLARTTGIDKSAAHRPPSVSARPGIQKRSTAKSHQGLLTGIMGVDDTYEPPIGPDLELPSHLISPHAMVDQLVASIDPCLEPQWTGTQPGGQ